MYMCVLYLFVVSIVQQHAFGQKKTILRTNWGVNFDEIDPIIIGAGLSNYVHSFAIPWPKIHYNISKPITCTDGMDWNMTCKAINKIIRNMNKYNYEVYSTASYTFQQAKSLLPQKGDLKNQTRFKRDIFSSIESAFGSGFHSLANAFTDLFHMPGHKDLTVLVEHLKELNGAMKDDSDAIRLFNNDLSSTQLLLNNRISNLLVSLNNTEDSISMIANNTDALYSNIKIDLQNIVNRTNRIADVASYVTTKLLLSLFSKHLLLHQLQEMAQQWHEGIITILTGYLTSLILPPEYISDIIEHITTNILAQPRYGHMKLISTNPSYYYKQKNIIGMVYKDHLLIVVKFPLKETSGLLTVYKTTSFPVPLLSGLMNTQQKSSTDSYSYIGDIPTYFAITNNGEYYMTLSTAMYESCEGEGIKVCKTGKLTLQRSTTISCISALFFDDTEGIKKSCSISLSKTPPMGSAVQLTGYDSFLIHGSLNGNDTWRLRCMNPIGNSQQSLIPCSMCRLNIPCFCTLGADQFEITPHMTECSDKINRSGQPKVTYFYHPNLAMITSLFPHNALARIHAFEASVNKLYPAINITLPHIRQSNWSGIIERDNTLQKDFKKIAKAANKTIQVYESKEDKIAAKVTNFSDVIVDRTVDLTKTVQDVFKLFGNFGKIIAAIFSPLGISAIALTLSCFQCLPNCFWQTKRYCLRIKKESSKSHRFNAKYSPLHETNDDGQELTLMF